MPAPPALSPCRSHSVDGEEIASYSEVITSNTSANVNTEILLSDYVDPNGNFGNFWTYKIKAQIDPATKKFSADEVTSTATYNGELYNIKVNVANGQIFPKGGLSKTGVVTDSIYFEIQFEDDTDDDGNGFSHTYVAHGHKRTGFTEDDY